MASHPDDTKQGFIDESIIAPKGKPIEYDGKPLKILSEQKPKEKPTFTTPHGCIVEEITMEEFLQERERHARLRAEALKGE